MDKKHLKKDETFNFVFCPSHDAAQISGTGTLYRGAYVSPGDDMKHNQVRCSANQGSFLDLQ